MKQTCKIWPDLLKKGNAGVLNAGGGFPMETCAVTEYSPFWDCVSIITISLFKAAFENLTALETPKWI